MLPLPSWVRTLSVALFVVSFIGGMALVSWYEVVQVRGDTLLATVVAIIVKGESVAVVAAAIGGAFEGGAFIVVIAYEMVKRGFDRGVARGRALERADIKRKLADYEKRRQEAHARGEEFNEPLPVFDDDDEQGQD